MKVYCIVVTYNGSAWVDNCFGSLIKSTVPIEIIAVDNASADYTVAIIKEKFPAVELIETGANLGFGQANNIGLKIALAQNADYVFLLNQDVFVKEDTIQKLLQVSKKNPRFGIISPVHLDVSETNFEQLFLSLFDRYNSAILPDLVFSRLKAVYEISYIHAAAWLMTRKCIETVGGFDPLYFHYGEDDDYLQRAAYFNFKIGLATAALIIHDAAFNSWDKLEWNENRNLVIAYQQLKKMSPHFRSNLLSFLKSGFDELTTLLLFRKFRKFRFRFAVLFKTMRKIKIIHQSYKASFTKGAFLK